MMGEPGDGISGAVNWMAWVKVSGIEGEATGFARTRSEGPYHMERRFDRSL
jgi:hypothetical protein